MITHNTALLKNASEVLETNAFDKLSLIDDKIQPIVKIEPYIDVVESVNAVVQTSDMTVYTCPTDKDFYLTNVSLSVGANIAVFGGAYLDFTLANNRESEISVLAIATDTGLGYSIPTTNSINMTFPKRGVLLKKGSVIKVSFDAGGTANIAGYTSSDRSGL